jgi:RNA polymerase sigma factor (TIGR02999 family)
MSSSPSLLETLAAAQLGDSAAEEAVVRMVYQELHGLAEAYMRRERVDHTLQPTELVHEAYLRLRLRDAPWKSRAHFYGIAAQTMRRILVDHARHRLAHRRDREVMITLDDNVADDATPSSSATVDIMGVHEALQALERVSERQARIVELMFFVGLSLDDIADTLGISAATVSREWTVARAWLHTHISDTP